MCVIYVCSYMPYVYACASARARTRQPFLSLRPRSSDGIPLPSSWALSCPLIFIHIYTRVSFFLSDRSLCPTREIKKIVHYNNVNNF